MGGRRQQSTPSGDETTLPSAACPRSSIAVLLNGKYCGDKGKLSWVFLTLREGGVSDGCTTRSLTERMQHSFYPQPSTRFGARKHSALSSCWSVGKQRSSTFVTTVAQDIHPSRCDNAWRKYMLADQLPLTRALSSTPIFRRSESLVFSAITPHARLFPLLSNGRFKLALSFVLFALVNQVLRSIIKT